MRTPSISVSRPVPWDQVFRARAMWSIAISSIRRPRRRSGARARVEGCVGFEGWGGVSAGKEP